MSHTDIESRLNPDGLQGIRSWASRSPDSARPGFRLRQPGGLRRAPRFAAFALLAAIVLLFSLAGFRFLQVGQDAPELAAVPKPEPEQVARFVEKSNAAPPPVAEAVADMPQARREPVQALDARPERPVPARREEPVVQHTSVPKKPEVVPQETVSQIVMGRGMFESEPAVLLAEPAAEYPEAARGTGTSAKVIVGFTIDETGAVRNPVIERIQIQGDAPKAPFEQAALAAARRARFTPAQERGVPTRSWNTLTFSFEAGLPPA